MKISLLDILVCPNCNGKLQLINGVFNNNEIECGQLICGSCHSVFKIVNYIPRFVDSDEYTDNFSFEWDKHRQTQFDSISGVDESERMFKQKTGFELSQLKDKLVLDVGCGAGRFIDVVEKYGGTVIGIDLSYSVDVAFKNLGFKDNVHIIQANVFHLPFRREVFDYIFSIGVLHHTPNTRLAFECLPRLLKKDGEIAIWVYSNEGFSMKLINTVSSFYRLLTTRLPKQFVYWFSYIAIPLYYPKRLKFLRPIFELLLPTSSHNVIAWRILDTFDWYSPKYQWKHTYNEVKAWFYCVGLTDVKQLEIPISVKGRKA